MRRFIKLAALLTLVAVLLSGCMDYTAIFSEALSQMDAGTDPDATPAPTMGPMTEPVFTDREALFAIYNEVNIGDTLEDMTARYGEPIVDITQEGTNYTWLDENGYGITAVFYDNNRLRAKVLYYNDIRQFMDLSNATTIDNFTNLSQKHDFDMVCLALGGKPVELAAIAQDSSMDPEIFRLFTWVDQEGSNVQVLFNEEEGVERISYALVEEE